MLVIVGVLSGDSEIATATTSTTSEHHYNHHSGDYNTVGRTGIPVAAGNVPSAKHRGHDHNDDSRLLGRTCFGCVSRIVGLVRSRSFDRSHGPAKRAAGGHHLHGQPADFCRPHVAGRGFHV